MDVFLRPVKRFAELSGEKAAPWIFPFLISDANFLMVYMAGVICFFSAAPFMEGRERYYLLREGRGRWLAEQAGDILASSFLFTVISVAVSWIPLIPVLKFESGWGKVIFTLAKTNAGGLTDLFWKLSAWYLSNHEPLEAMLATILIVSLGSSFLGMLMFLCRLCLPKAYSIGIPAVMVVYSSVVANVGSFSEKLFFAISPISWMRVTRLGFTEYGYQVSWQAQTSIIVFAVLILILIIAGRSRIRRMDIT